MYGGIGVSQGVPDPLIGQVLDGRYAITRKLGTGGMGAVYEADQRSLGRKVAIKTIHAHLASKAIVVERFRREAMAAANAGSQHIVDVYDLGVMPSGVPYMVMELIEGTDLRTLVEEHGRLATSVAAHVVRQACDALEAAHEIGIIHRDVKPENIMITKRRNDPVFVKVVDFGISKLRDSSLTGSHELLGTPYAMAPEQLRGAGQVDARCDIYGLGVCLYYALSGDVPYTAETLSLLITKISTGERVPLKSRVHDLPALAYDLVATATAHDPSRRFRSMSAFAAALRTLENTAPDASLAPTAHLEQPEPAPRMETPRIVEPKGTPPSLVEPKAHEAIPVHAGTTERLPTTAGSKLVGMLVVLGLVGGVAAGAYFGLEAWKGTRSTTVSSLLDAQLSIDAGITELVPSELVPSVPTEVVPSEHVPTDPVSTIRVTGLTGAEVRAGQRECVSPCSLALPAGERSVQIGYAGKSLDLTLDAGEHRSVALGAARSTVENGDVQIGPHRCDGPCVVPLRAGRYSAIATRGSGYAETSFTVRAGEITALRFLLFDAVGSMAAMTSMMRADTRADMRPTGRVSIRAVGAPIAIRVDQQTCHTPCTLAVPEGEHIAFATRDGRTTQHRFVARAGRTVDLGINPPSSGASSSLGTLVVGGGALRIQVGGQSCATTPCSLQLPPGTHRMLVTHPDGSTSTRRVDIRPGATSRVALRPIQAY